MDHFYAELHCHSNFSFLDGASHPEDLVSRAVTLGLPALALTDHDGLYGAIGFYKACRAAGIKPVIGAELTIENGSHLTLIAKNHAGYSNLCRLITKAQISQSKGNPALSFNHLIQHSKGLFCLSGCRKGEIPGLILSDKTRQAHEAAGRFLDIFGRDHFLIELQNNFYPEDIELIKALSELAKTLRIRCVATNNVHYCKKEGRKLHDVLHCIKNRSTLDRCQTLRLNSEFYLKSPVEMKELFRAYPEAVSNTVAVAGDCDVSLDFSSYRFPDFPLPPGESPETYLCRLCFERVKDRYASNRDEAERRIRIELDLIGRLNLAGYFLIVWDIMEYARKNGIPAQGRGSAANSIVAYLLGITKVDPIKHRLFLGRFLNEEMAALPDIDIDISTYHREELIQYVYRKYGQEHTAMVCTYVTFQARNAIRQVGKALGLPEPLLDGMAKSAAGYGAGEVEEDLGKIDKFRPYFSSGIWQEFVSLCREIADFPRHPSIHVGGMLISSCPLTDVVPLEKATMPGRVVCQWDKDGVADAGLIKIDLLGLRMLSLIEEARQLIEKKKGIRLNPDALPPDDAEVYDIFCKADTIGVFQVESRAQIQILPQSQPRSLEDLTIEVAIIRPGPIQGNMVNPYLQRRKGLEEVTYLHPKLKPILEETLGVILFQEQVIQAAVLIAGFSPGEADFLRRTMSRKRSRQEMGKIRQRFLDGAKGNKVDEETADRIFAALEGFAEYGFCKSHAAGFALLCYQSAWIKKYHAAEFYAALLNNQPMGFYTPDVIVNDARRHEVTVLPVDINKSETRCSVEEEKVRLGFAYVKGIGKRAEERVMKEREKAPFSSLEDFFLRTGLEAKQVENLILAGAFDCFRRSKRELLWDLGMLEKRVPGTLPLRFPGVNISLPSTTDLEEMRADYEVLGLSPRYHPMEILRERVGGEGMIKSSGLNKVPSGSRVRLAGYVISRQRPGTAKGFSFLTLEDGEGMMNIVIKPAIYEKYRQVFRLEPMVGVEGIVQKRDGVINIIAEKLSAFKQRKEEQKVFYQKPSWIEVK